MDMHFERKGYMQPTDYLKKIESKGFKAYIVGGYVRDKILGRKSSDVDITTNATPKEICEIFEISNKDNLGSINIKTGELNIDITTFRKESNYLGHHPRKLSYVDDLETDLKRRDFTMNTICMDKDGNIIDLLGGKKDLNNRVLKVVGDVKKKFTEDPLRMLRAIRLATIYDLKIGDDEVIFIVNNRKLFDKISYDRKKEEIGKMLISKNALKGLGLLKVLGLMDTLEISIPHKIIKVDDYIGMWAQLEFSDKYTFSRCENSRIKSIREILSHGHIDARTIYKYGLYDTLVAGRILGYNRDELEEIYANMSIHTESDLVVNGNDIKNFLHIPSSPKIKSIKDDIIEKILDGNLPNNKDEINAYIMQNWK